MTGTDVLSFVVGLLALAAFFAAAIVMTILLVRDAELPENTNRREAEGTRM